MSSKQLKLKVCGMRDPENITQLLKLNPDFMGMIFYAKSSRNVTDVDPAFVRGITDTQKIGVFVNESLTVILEKQRMYHLDLIQLHGQETPELCQELKSRNLGVIKVFSVGQNFDFDKLQPYESYVDYFLFDTKGKHPGGNGVIFNWDILADYPSQKPFFLSGGISLELSQAFPEHPQLFALDVNSKFEIRPGLKNIEMLQALKETLQ